MENQSESLAVARPQSRPKLSFRARRREATATIGAETELAAAAHGTPTIVALALLLAAVIGVALLRWSMST